MIKKQEEWLDIESIEELPTYQDILSYLSKKKRTKHLFLGNGFSVAYDSKIFSYNALSKYIENSSDSHLNDLFNLIKTRNFEEVMHQLDIFKEFATNFKAPESFISSIVDTSQILRRSLIDAVKEMHPEHVFKIPEEKLKNCSAFLDDYLNNEGYIFSSNYDLLLYWVLLRGACQNAGDGFGRDVEKITDDYVPDDELEWSELRWDRNIHNQTIYYLHGALHLFDVGTEIVKEEYGRNNFLLEKIKTRIERNHYPLFVMAGDAHDKLKYIRHNRYLDHCYTKLASLKDCSLITYGFSFGDNDTHIIDAINSAAKRSIDKQLWSLYISAYKNEDLVHLKNIKDKFKLKVNVYNARSVKIW